MFLLQVSVSAYHFSVPLLENFISGTLFIKLFDFNITDKIDKFDIDGILKFEDLEKEAKNYC